MSLLRGRQVSCSGAAHPGPAGRGSRDGVVSRAWRPILVRFTHLLPMERPRCSASAAACRAGADGPGCPELEVGPWEGEAPWDAECLLRWGQQGPRSAGSRAGGTGGLPAAAGVRVGHAGPRLGRGGGLQAAVFALSPESLASLPPSLHHSEACTCLLYRFPVFKVTFSWKRRVRCVHIIHS